MERISIFILPTSTLGGRLIISLAFLFMRPDIVRMHCVTVCWYCIKLCLVMEDEESTIFLFPPPPFFSLFLLPSLSLITIKNFGEKFIHAQKAAPHPLRKIFCFRFFLSYSLLLIRFEIEKKRSTRGFSTFRFHLIEERERERKRCW